MISTDQNYMWPREHFIGDDVTTANALLTKTGVVGGGGGGDMRYSSTALIRATNSPAHVLVISRCFTVNILAKCCTSESQQPVK